MHCKCVYASRLLDTKLHILGQQRSNQETAK